VTPRDLVINLSYLISALLFIFGLKMLSAPSSARRGNFFSAVGMLIAIVVTLLDRNIVQFQWIAIGMVIGSIIGLVAARRVAMTAMPEMVGLFNGSGGIASLLVGWTALYEPGNVLFTHVTIALSILIGGVTFSGSVLAWGKLSEKMTSRAVVFGAQRVINALLLLAAIVSSVLFVLDPSYTSPWLFALIALSLILGVMAVLPIGGADMPVVISLLNSYSGLAGCAAGFVINNNILIVAGAMVGASGIILTNIMCKAMNRSLANVLFSGFGAVVQAGDSVEGEVKPVSVEDAYLIMEAASSVVFVPGYGMAVAQAQHVVRELADLLEKNGCEVVYAIHPVAGRMPGHMNVLLAEANVPYEQLVEMDEINPRMPNVDVAVVIGANDVVNPAARTDPASPIYGMPIIDVDKAQTVMVLKRSMASGFAGIPNPLFFAQNTRMLFGDAKQTISGLVRAFKS
jgi:NAD(P) transhydrogenase subunit beta